MVGFILLTLLVTLARAATSTHYHIVPITSTALCKHYQGGTCFTLEELSSQVSVTDTGNMAISFLPGEHLLTWNMTFNSTNDLILNRELHNHSNSTPRITCLRYTGFDFLNVYNLTIAGLEIHGCERNWFGVIRVYNVPNVLIEECTFTNNQVINEYNESIFGGGVVYVELSRMRIQNSTFLNNSAKCSVCFGGAIYVVASLVKIDSSSFELNTAMNGGALMARGALQTVVIVINTNFVSNSALNGGSVFFIGDRILISNSLLINNTAKISGGAIYGGAILESSGNVYSGNIAKNGGAVYGQKSETGLRKDNFLENMAQYGGAALFEEGQTIEISESNFTRNQHTTEGAGAVYIRDTSVIFGTDVFFLNNNGSLYTFNSHLTFTGNTTFSSNTGESGGAITSIASVMVFETLSTTIITRNVASFGGGLYMDQSTIDSYGLLLIEDNRAAISGGGVYGFQSVIELRPQSKLTAFPLPTILDRSVLQNTNITNNIANKNGGGIHLTASTIKASNSYIHIYDNTAEQYGGGVYLEQASKINLNKWIQEYPHVFPEKHPDIFTSFLYIRLEFKNNSALRGGAVYVLDSTNAGVLCEGATSTSEINLSSNQCFIQTLRLYVRINFTFAKIINTFFKNNVARETGSDIYGGLLDRCAISPLAEILSEYPRDKSYSGLQYFNATASFHKNITNTSDFYDRISSDAVRVCFCEKDIADCNSTHPTVLTRKGELFELNVAAVDQVSKPVKATIFSSLTSNNGGIERLKEGQEARKIENQCTKLEYNVYSNDSIAELQLYADGPCSSQGISKQQVNISFLPCKCPIGLERYPPSIDCVCNCDKRIQPYVTNCSPLNSTIQINANVWIDYINTTNTSGFLVQHCPFDYCVEKPVNISLASRSETDQQCAYNRTGRMCGQCEEGLSLVFASSRCRECSNYYLFLLLVFALAGILLVAFILLLNMTVATGTIHGLIFYANMLAANRSIFLPFSTPNVLTVFISWLNLDLGIEICFYNGMDSYGKVLFQLAFPAYVFLMIAIIIVLCDRSQKLADFVGKRNPEATLYTLILLSYSKLIRIIITALQFTTINYSDGTQKRVWLYDANVLYFSVNHIPQFLAAFAIIILGTVYTTLLLFGQLFDRCSEHKLMKWTTHKYYTHFIRAHQAPLSDKHRYWVGLLLLARLTHYLISSFLSDSVVILSVGTIAFVLVLHKLLNKQIYNSWSLDLLETSFLVNLDILALSTFYVRDASGKQQALAFISMTICFITFLGIVLYHILDKCGIKLGTLPQRALELYRRRRPYQPAPNEEEDREELFDEDIQIDERQNYTNNTTNESKGQADYHTPPIIRHAVRDDQLREPALDDLIPVQPEDYYRPPAHRPQRREMVTFTEVDIRADREDNN